MARLNFSKLSLFILLLLIALPSVWSNTVDVNIWRFTTNGSTGSGIARTFYFEDQNAPFLSYYRDGNITIDFNVSGSDADTNGLLLDINLTSSNAAGGGDRNYVIYTDLNLGARKMAGESVNLCDSNAFSERVSCRIDLNISQSIVSVDGNFFIRMRVYDTNTGLTQTAGAASDTNWSNRSVGIDNTAPNLRWDGNHATWQNFDANIHLSCTDYNTTGGDSNNSGCGTARFRVDTNPSSTIAMPAAFSDYNSGVDRNILVGFGGDGNYAVDWNVTDQAGNPALCSSTISGSTDFNRTYVYRDKTAPSLTITNTGGNGGSTTVTGLSFTLTYSQNDGNGSGVDTYWFSDNNSTWTNNTTATSYAYSISPAASLPTTVTLYLIGNDGTDYNSETVLYHVTFQSGSGGGSGPRCGDGVCTSPETTSTCAIDCKAVCGDKVCTGNESSATCPQDCVEGCGNTQCEEPTESCQVCPIDCGICSYTQTNTLFSKELTSQPTQGEILTVLQDAGLSQAQIATAYETMRQINVGRTVTVDEQKTANGISLFVVSFEVSVLNPTDKEIRNVKVVERIPKELAQSAGQIVSDIPFVILKDDPIVQFSIPRIAPNSRQTVSYTISSVVAVSESSFDQMAHPIVSNATFAASTPTEECAKDSDCEDNNSCTNNTCVANACVFTPVSDGSVCGFGKECRAGICTETETNTGTKTGSLDWTWIAGGAVILILALGFYARTRKKQR